MSDRGCGSPLGFIMCLVLDTLLCGLGSKLGNKTRKKQAQKSFSPPSNRASIITVSMLFFLIITALIPSAAAMPAANGTDLFNNLVDKQILPHTQSCKVHQQFLVFSYNVHIGELYNKGAHCNKLFKLVRKASHTTVSMWRCNNDGNGDTTLHYNVLAWRTDIDALNKGLGEIYPEVNGLSCPDH